MERARRRRRCRVCSGRTPPELYGGEDAKETLAEGDEGRQQHHGVGGEVMRLERIDLKERAEEAVRREARAAYAMRAENHPNTLQRRRRNLRLRRAPAPHVVL